MMVEVTSAAYLAWPALPLGVTMRTGMRFLPAFPASTNSKGPMAMATRELGSGRVGAKTTFFLPLGSSLWETGEVLETAACSFGMWTVICQGVLKSGWSKQGKARRASVGSYLIGRGACRGRWG